MTIQEIYSSYNIMPSLQIHQLRTAAVAKIICDSIPDFPDTREVVTACLLHDMGNILKFDLGYFPQFLEPEGFEYWQSVKNEYLEKYGPDEHVATEMIIEDVVSSPKVKECAAQIGFSKLAETAADPSLAKKICAYADMRVTPQGIVPIEERLEEARKRYEGRIDKAIASEKYGDLADALWEIEKQVFAVSDIRPEDIADESVMGEIKNAADMFVGGAEG